MRVERIGDCTLYLGGWGYFRWMFRRAEATE